MRRKNSSPRFTPRDALSVGKGVAEGVRKYAGLGLLAMLFTSSHAPQDTRTFKQAPDAIETTTSTLIKPDFSYAAQEITADIARAVDCAPKSSFWNTVGRMTGAYRPGGTAVHGPDGDKSPFMIFGEKSSESGKDGYLPLTQGWVIAYNEPSDTYDFFAFHTEDVQIRLKSQVNDVPVESTVVAPYIIGSVIESGVSRQDLINDGGRTFSAFGMTLSLNPPANEHQRVVTFSFGCG